MIYLAAGSSPFNALSGLVMVRVSIHDTNLLNRLVQDLHNYFGDPELAVLSGTTFSRM